jgi:cell division protein FtsQ
VAVAAVAVVAGAAWVVGYSDLLTADRVEVTGAQPPLAEQVRSVADVPLGTALARLDTDAVTARVEGISDIASVSVTRSWPSTVVVAVEPRQPVAVMAAADGPMLVDGEGVMFAGSTADPADALDLPELVAPTTDDGVDARRAGVSVAVALPPAVVRQLERIEAPSPVEVRLVLDDGRVVTWGSAEQPERKAEVLAALLDTPATQYDVSVPDRPTVRPAPAG